MGTFKQNQRGDTIVEVLIAMVILAFVLTGAYESAQYSLNSIINAENRITALNQATSQIESLKEVLSTNPTSISTTNKSNFYIDYTKSEYQYKATTTPQPTLNGGFLYYFLPPAFDSTTGNYTFTVDVYWRNLNFGTANSNCNVNNLSECNNVTVSYRAAI
ncbi:MAG TPA: prepilin-type N-terminal cleavage/methylation domain-containing protein [Candidatus Saccharimonadales bacterium]|jgi:prepilin-type N-terminal cleavage/methylation domain-containing protein|nr:prepilin-type N-terminal cleavage/methylation domain-containing protein [Candidatus Saccharimonadales bacterium]